MTDHMMYLRFADTTIVGKSKYRPSEGWIDVVSYSIVGPQLMHGSDRSGVMIFSIDHREPSGRPLFVAAASGQHIHVTVFDVHVGVPWTRYEMHDVFVESITDGGAGDLRVLSISLNCAKVTMSYVGGPPAKGKYVVQARK